MYMQHLCNVYGATCRMILSPRLSYFTHDKDTDKPGDEANMFYMCKHIICVTCWQVLMCVDTHMEMWTLITSYLEEIQPKCDKSCGRYIYVHLHQLFKKEKTYRILLSVVVLFLVGI